MFTDVLFTGCLYATGAAFADAPRPAAEKALIVRTIGPDSRAFSVALNPKVATVGELRERVPPLG